MSFWNSVFLPSIGPKKMLGIISVLFLWLITNVAILISDKLSVSMSFGTLELQNRVTRSSCAIKFHFELLTHRLNFYFSTFELITRILTNNNNSSTNSKLKNKKFHFELQTQWVNFYFITFELLTRGRKIKSFTSSY